MDEQIAQVGAFFARSPDEAAARTRIIDAVSACVAEVCSYATVEAYGSSVYGLDLYFSDIDLCAQPTLPLKTLASAISNNRWAVDVQAISARYVRADVRMNSVPVWYCQHCAELCFRRYSAVP